MENKIRLFLHAKAERACVFLFRKAGSPCLDPWSRSVAREFLKMVSPVEFALRKSNWNRHKNIIGLAGKRLGRVAKDWFQKNNGSEK